jgi:lipopolysaccharide heptosyltransferase II
MVWAIEPAAFPLVEHHLAVDEIILFDRNHWRKSLGPFLRQIRSRRFDLVLDLQRHLKSGLISWWSGAPHRLGFHRRDAKEFNWLFNNCHISPATDGISKLSHYLKFAEFLGIEPYPIEWNFHLLAGERARVASMLQHMDGPFAAFCVGSRWESKRWFPAETARSATELQKRYRLEIVLLGGKEDVGFAREVEGCEGARVVNWVGQTSLREAIGILSRAEVAVGPDSGLMHLSAAVGTPVVSLWGATDPIQTGAYGYHDLVIRGKASCSPCYLRRCPIGRLCMQSIEIEEVIAKVAKALSGKGRVSGIQI